ncbi:MAG: hypothetical protein LBI62_04400, partial [Candidatus Accumulibacter sp.]|nr:hypothetical protein [Accumulibacter sp.]
MRNAFFTLWLLLLWGIKRTFSLAKKIQATQDQMSDVRCQMSDVRCQMSGFSARMYLKLRVQGNHSPAGVFEGQRPSR